MITLAWWQAVLFAWLFTFGGVCLGVGVVLWWQGVPRGGERWDRSLREWEQDRFGTAYDGGLRGVRFIPFDRDDDG